MSKSNKKINYEDIEIFYTIESSMACSNGYRYRQQINGVMHYFNENNNPDKSVVIGKIEAQ